MQVFVAGATGVVGTRLVRALLKAGHQVTATITKPEKTSVIQAMGAEPVVMNGFLGTLKYEHLCRSEIPDEDSLAMETNRFRHIYNTIRPHQSVGDHTPRQAYLRGSGIIEA